MTRKRLAVGYIRVSTEDQAAEGVSLEAQRARIAAWCEANGYELAGVHVDAGISGRRADNRPALPVSIRSVSETRSAPAFWSRAVRSSVSRSERARRLRL